ncbi:hypothetical protein EJB05_46034, partial [Eragrostis curvula]
MEFFSILDRSGGVIFETTASSPVKKVLEDDLSEGYSFCNDRAIFETTDASSVKEVLEDQLSEGYSSCDERAILEMASSSPVREVLDDEPSEGVLFVQREVSFSLNTARSSNDILGFASFLSESLQETVSSPGSVDSTDQSSSGWPECVASEEEAGEPSENSSDEADEQYTLMLRPTLGAATPYRPGYCTACNRDGSPNLCYRYMARLKIGIQEACKYPLGSGRFSYCLQCQTLVEDLLLLGLQTRKDGQLYSRVSRVTHWNSISGRPFLLQKPQGIRCKHCLDIVGDDTLYCMLVQFCTIECWLHSRVAAAEYEWVNQMVNANFDRWPQPPFDAYCVSCCLPFSCVEEGGQHKHDNEDKYIRIVTNTFGGSVKVEIERDHFMARRWTCVQDSNWSWRD